MSTTLASTATARATPRDTRTLRRVAAAVLLPIGPLTVAAIRGTIPYFTDNSPEQLVANAASGLGQLDVVLWLSLIGMIALIPSTLAAARLTQRRAPVLSLVAVCLLVPAFSTLFASSGDSTLRLLASGTIDQATAVTLLNEFSALTPVAIGLVIFILGHIAGYVLLGVAMWKARVVPVWAAIAVLVSQPLHFVFAVVMPNQLLDTVAWGLAGLGLAVAAVRVLRTSNDDWDLAPIPTR